MRAYELLESPSRIALGIYDPAQDRLHTRSPSDLRKSTIILRDLNRLKHIRNARRREGQAES